MSIIPRPIRKTYRFCIENWDKWFPSLKVVSCVHIARQREKAFADARLFRTPILRRIFCDESPKCHFPYPAVTAAQRCRPWPIRHCLSLVDAVTATKPFRGHVRMGLSIHRPEDHILISMLRALRRPFGARSRFSVRMESVLLLFAQHRPDDAGELPHRSRHCLPMRHGLLL